VELDDKTLMIKAVEGDLDQIGVLYQRYRMPLYSYFFKLTSGEKSHSEDLVQTVFYRVLKYRDQFKGNGSFAGWLFTIAHHVGIDFHKNQQQYKRRHENVREDHAMHEEADILEKAESSLLLLKALDMLKQEEREILVMSKQESLKYSEIAEIFKCTENVMKVRIFRALSKLKEIYNKLENS
jgi:RNA polymerase sigma factor (sigma-70 family)